MKNIAQAWGSGAGLHILPHIRGRFLFHSKCFKFLGGDCKFAQNLFENSHDDAFFLLGFVAFSIA